MITLDTGRILSEYAKHVNYFVSALKIPTQDGKIEFRVQGSKLVIVLTGKLAQSSKATPKANQSRPFPLYIRQI